MSLKRRVKAIEDEVDRQSDPKKITPEDVVRLVQEWKETDHPVLRALRAEVEARRRREEQEKQNGWQEAATGAARRDRRPTTDCRV